MKRLTQNLTVIASLILGSLISINTTSAQAKFQAQSVSLSVKGTSSIHDWEEKAEAGNANATIDINGTKVSIASLSFSVPAKNLKSGHGMMDKNTYKALNTEQHPNITFVLTSATVTPVDGNTYQIKGVGNLTIAGTTRQTDVVATAKWNATEKSFVFSGAKKFKMTDYKVEPPTAMFGTIKTGDEVTVSYNLKLKG